jgi:hypothetical protein
MSWVVPLAVVQVFEAPAVACATTGRSPVRFLGKDDLGDVAVLWASELTGSGNVVSCDVTNVITSH